jgi:hypothetical protein
MHVYFTRVPFISIRIFFPFFHILFPSFLHLYFSVFAEASIVIYFNISDGGISVGRLSSRFKFCHSMISGKIQNIHRSTTAYTSSESRLEA